MWPQSRYGQPHDISLLIGRLLEQQANTDRRMDRHETRLEAGDDRMDEMSERIASLETTAKSPRSSAMPRWEVIVKTVLPYAIGLATLLVTGSLEQAIKIILAVLTGGK